MSLPKRTTQLPEVTTLVNAVDFIAHKSGDTERVNYSDIKDYSIVNFSVHGDVDAGCSHEESWMISFDGGSA